jgi:outer membrane murein-binding lipoprotein Lpp
MTFNKTKLTLGIAAATFSVAFMVPQAQADSSATVQAEALSAQMQQMATQMQAMQVELDRVKAAAATSAQATTKVQELDQWMASVKSTPEEASAKDNVVRVRGGWGMANNPRGNGNVAGALGANGDPLVGVGNSTQSMYYYGAAFDYNINNDLFGLHDGTSFQIEFGAEYGQFANHTQSGLTTLSQAGITTTTGNSSAVQVNQIRINASPKIKFMHDSKLRPWLIPVGLDITVVSPPSGSVTVLGTGMNFGGGVDYDLWRGILVGLDGRYHYSTSSINGVNTDGFTLGGSVGFKF